MPPKDQTAPAACRTATSATARLSSSQRSSPTTQSSAPPAPTSSDASAAGRAIALSAADVLQDFEFSRWAERRDVVGIGRLQHPQAERRLLRRLPGEAERR